MHKITKKSELIAAIQPAITAWQEGGVTACAAALQDGLLAQKVKFPLLEQGAALLFESLPDTDHIPLCDNIERMKTIGGNVLLGIMLQKRLHTHFEASMEQAATYISLADAWYVCDIIGERVWGYALWKMPERAFPVITQLAAHPSRWVVRSLGAGGHFAVKRGLEKDWVEQLFHLLLQMAHTADKEIRQGVGWAAKTTAKFHPDIVEKHQHALADSVNVAPWFRYKIKIGLNRHRYAQRNRS